MFGPALLYATSVSSATLLTLWPGTDQLKRMHGEIDKVEEHLNFADKTIRGMESVWGSFRNYMSKGTDKVKKVGKAAVEGSMLDKAAGGRLRRTPRGTSGSRWTEDTAHGRRGGGG